jgi:extracellular solute-binding protein (family 5)
MQPISRMPLHSDRAMHRRRAAVILCSLSAWLAGCVTPSHSMSNQPTAGRPCVVSPSDVASTDSLAVAATSPINPAHAPFPTNAAERFVFAQVYETLIGVDCEGHAAPALAHSWTLDATKTRVTLVLRDDARFATGDPVLARDVVAAWRTTSSTSPDSSLARRLADATTIVDDRTLIVSLPDTESLVLAEPALAVSRASGVSRWALGTGPYRVAESAADVAPGRLSLVPVAAGATPRLSIRTGPDARDAIDAGVDLLLGADPVAERYAASRPDLGKVPIPWQSTYVLAVPSRTPSVVADVPAAASDSAATFRASLARDAVRADAQAAAASGWWTGAGCELKTAYRMGPRSRGQPRIVYRADDHVARELAERLVALGRRAVAAPLSATDFEDAFTSGSEAAYIVALPWRSIAPCRDMTILVAASPWLARTGAVGDMLIPLVDTRQPPIANRRRVAATIDWDGTLHISTSTGRR